MGTPQPITERTFAFAVRIVNLCKVLDESPGVARTMSRQLIRSVTLIETNVEEAQSAQSTALTIQNTKFKKQRQTGRVNEWWCDLMPIETAKAISAQESIKGNLLDARRLATLSVPLELLRL